MLIMYLNFFNLYSEMLLMHNKNVIDILIMSHVLENVEIMPIKDGVVQDNSFFTYVLVSPPNVLLDPCSPCHQISHLQYQKIKYNRHLHIYTASFHVPMYFLQCQFPSIGRISDDGRFLFSLFSFFSPCLAAQN